MTLLAGTYVGHKINQGRIRAEEKVKWGEEILRSQNRLQALFDGAPDAIAIVDRNFRISMVNKTGLNWYKKSLEDFIGKICHQEFQGGPDLCPNCPAEESFRTGQPAFREKSQPNRRWNQALLATLHLSLSATGTGKWWKSWST